MAGSCHSRVVQYLHRNLQSANKCEKERSQIIIPHGLGRLADSRCSFGCTNEGDQPAWRPLRAFDAGRQTYIEFSKAIAQEEAPPLFVIGPTVGAELVNYRLRGNFYVVDRLSAAAELRLGTKPQSREAEYIDNIDGKIGEALFNALTAQFRDQERKVSRELALRDSADLTYTDEAIALLSLVRDSKRKCMEAGLAVKRRVLFGGTFELFVSGSKGGRCVPKTL